MFASSRSIILWQKSKKMWIVKSSFQNKYYWQRFKIWNAPARLMKTNLTKLHQYKIPANLSGYYTDTSLGRSPPGNRDYKTGIVPEFYLLKPDNTGVLRLLLPHSCQEPPDFLLQHHRLKFHTLGSSSSSSQKHNGREEFCRSLFKRPRGKTFSRTFATKIKSSHQSRTRSARRDGHTSNSRSTLATLPTRNNFMCRR